MEKEMKKLLLVAVSVGVFLLVTITAAIVILTPKVNTQETAFSSSRPYSAGRVQPAEITREVITQPEPTQAVISNTVRDETNTVVITDRNNGDSLTIGIPRPAVTSAPDTAEIVQSTRPSSTQTTAAVTPARTTPAASTRTTTSTPARTTAAAPTRQTAPAKAINDFWVQTGAFSAIVRAEDAKEMLASKGITSIIENRIIDGRVWYRVRLGPYTSENEANYWLALVQTINGFEGSQIRQTIRQQ